MAYELKQLTGQDQEQMIAFYTGVFTQPPWNDDWSDKAQLSSYMEDMVFDEEVFYETEKRLDLINSLKAKYGKSITEILEYLDSRQEKLSQLEKYEENLKKAKRAAHPFMRR